MINQIKSKHSVEALPTIKTLKYFGHILRTSDSMEKIFVLRLTCSSKKGRHNRRRTTRNPDDKLARNHNHRLILNCNAKQRNGMTAFTRPWKIRSNGRIRVSKTWWLLLRKSIGITTGRLRPEGTTTITTDYVDNLYYKETNKDGLAFKIILALAIVITDQLVMAGFFLSC
jgi:hypothetical protein